MIPPTITASQYLWIQVYTVAMQRSTAHPSSESGQAYARTVADIAVKNFREADPQDP